MFTQRWLLSIASWDKKRQHSCHFAQKIFCAMFDWPIRWQLLLEQAEFVGIGSLFIVGLTAFFTGAVFTLQSINAMGRVNMQSLVGSSVMIAVTRELGPVLSALMVTGRVGSAMATELGTMRVSEQIDAIEVMAVDPLRYLLVPRIWACILMLPVLTILFDVIALLGSYLVAVILMAIDEGSYWARIASYLQASDYLQGLLKASVFGLIIATIACYQGYHASGGARGVGQATTQTVVLSSIAIFMTDYIMTAMLLHILAY